MPIYMDRHDISEGVTAEIVAQLHQEDLKIQDQYNCRGLTYWFDEIRNTAFCLVEAPDINAIQKMHKEAHGEVPTSIIEVDGTIVESFLGRIKDPEKAQHEAVNVITDSAFRTIMVIALTQSSLRKTDSYEEKFPLPDHTQAVLNLLRLDDGQPVKQMQNYFLVSFKSVSNAIHAACAIQSFFKDSNNGINDHTISLKIGLNAGLPVTEKKSIFEDTIKLAERMCVVKGEVIVSSEVHELYSSENSKAVDGKENIVVLTRADETFLTHLMDYTEFAWSNTNLKVDDFSKHVGCSKSQLYRKLLLLTGKSLNTFIREYRLKEALTLLTKNYGNVSEIAFETGFSSPSYFSKCFQKKYGFLPSYYLAAK